MGRFLDDFVTWALKKKRWPLLLLVGIPFVIFPFIRNYFGLSFRETCNHWLFWIFDGALCILAGVLYWVVSPRKGRLFRAGALAIIGVIALLAGLHRHRPPPLPEDRLVVAIARFTPISPGAEEEANNVPSRIDQRLLELQNEGAPLEPKLLLKRVSGIDEEDKRNAAIALCRSREVNAHLILWGEVRKDEGELYVRPRLTIANQLRGARMEERRLGDFVSVEPRQLQFKERLSTELADLMTLVYGVAYFKVGRWDQALRALDFVQSREGHLYRGLCLLHRAEKSGSPQQDLTSAVADYEKVLGPRPWSLNSETDAVTWAAYFNRTTATGVLGLFTSPKQSVGFLREAVDGYRAMLRVRTRVEPPQDWAGAQYNLGHALRELGTRVGGEEGNGALRDAVEAYQSALQVRTRSDLPHEWAATQTSLGAALAELGKRVGGGEGNTLLWQAAQAQRDALQVFTPTEFPQEWAGTQNTLGTALFELGSRRGGRDGNDLLREALEAYRDALQVLTRAQVPRDWAAAETNLGNALAKSGDRVAGEEGNTLLREAVDAYRSALQVHTRADLPQGWAMTQNNLCIALRMLGARVGGEEGQKLLRGAVQACRDALEVRTRGDVPQPWANTQDTMGNALVLLGRGARGEEGNRLLRQAVEAYRGALQVRTRAHLPHDWAGTRNDLGIGLTELGKRKAGKQGLTYLNEALVCFDDALSVYDEANYSQRHKDILTYKNEVIRLIQGRGAVKRVTP